MVQVIVLSGDGVNCERETAAAFSRSGAQVKIVHINTFLEQPNLLDNVSILALPGGFSFGDEVRSGVVLARKIEKKFGQKLKAFVSRGGLVLGICNGFQVLAQLGVFGKVTLAKNRQGIFIDRWVEIDNVCSDSPWLSALKGQSLCLPIRHGEGRLVVEEEEHFRVALKYRDDVNGAYEQSAGIVDSSGQIFGLMPHPEAALDVWLHPYEQGAHENSKNVKKIFDSAIGYSRSKQ